MNECRGTKRLLGQYSDGELEPSIRTAIAMHLASCENCSHEREELNSLAEAIAEQAPVDVPPRLWQSIECQLDEREVLTKRSFAPLRSRSLLALAASITIAVGLGLFSIPWTREIGSEANAAAVDFSSLLEGVHTNVHAAFDGFLSKYSAKAVAPADAKRYAPDLNFEVPATLPGGFELHATYLLHFGETPGVAAHYERDGEFLGAIFHAPVLREHFGTYKDHACVVGEHRGHKVPVGEWSLVHLTDATTCHCVLSRLDEAVELPAVMAAVAPHLTAETGEPAPDHHHGP